MEHSREGTLRSRLHELDPATFESLIGELLQRAGFEEIEVTRRERDGGIDVRAILMVGGLSRVTRPSRSSAGGGPCPEVVRELRGALSVHEQGLMVTTSKFTRDATAEATATGRAPIGLVNGDTLIECSPSSSWGDKAGCRAIRHRRRTVQR